MGEYEPDDSRNVTLTSHAAPGEGQPTGSQERNAGSQGAQPNPPGGHDGDRWATAAERADGQRSGTAETQAEERGYGADGEKRLEKLAEDDENAR